MIQIFVDSGANLSAELREQYNIHLLPMALTINDQPAPEGLDGHEYYEALRSGADVRTSMVNPDDAKKAFETYVSQGTTWCISAFPPASAAAGGRPSWLGTS